MAERQKSLVPGVLLIIIGLWLLAHRFFYFNLHWFRVYPVVLILFAALLFVETFRRHHSGALFWGVVVFVVGVFFALRNFEIIPYYYADEYWPVFMMAMGLGFLALFVFRPGDWGVLIPAGIFLFFGTAFALRTFGLWFWGWGRFLENYWPVVLIFIGVGVLASGLGRLPKKE